MVIPRWVRIAVIVIAVIVGFGALWLAQFTGNEVLGRYVTWAIWGLLAVGIVASFVRRRSPRHKRPTQGDQVAVDPVGSIYQGNRPPTFFTDSADATSQITNAPPPDPLRLPDDERGR